MVSTKGRYALRVMIDLARQEPGTPVPLDQIAGRQGISKKYLELILKTLVQKGLLKGQRGKGGGYRLVRPAEQYTVGSILRLTEGSLAPVACLSQGPRPCPRGGECRTLPMWKELDRRVNEYLDSVTVADLAACAGSGDDYVI